jgi:hypothetical protein
MKSTTSCPPITVYVVQNYTVEEYLMYCVYIAIQVEHSKKLEATVEYSKVHFQ